jgi:hypothetical protein
VWKRPGARLRRSVAERWLRSVPLALRTPTPLARCIHMRRKASSAVTELGTTVIRGPMVLLLSRSEFSDDVVDGDGGMSDDKKPAHTAQHVSAGTSLSHLTGPVLAHLHSHKQNICIAAQAPPPAPQHLRLSRGGTCEAEVFDGLVEHWKAVQCLATNAILARLLVQESDNVRL